MGWKGGIKHSAKNIVPYCERRILKLVGESVNSGLDYWNGLPDWNTGLTSDLKFSLKYGQFSSVCV